jgi:phosphoribosylformimino-5-aminoimidazole carboxamide ribotide isomerase
VRTEEHVRALRSAGAARVVLGSAALRDEALTRSLLESEGHSLVVGIEIGGDGRIHSRGVDPVDLPLMESLGWLVPAGSPAFLVTAVARVGSSIGPDIEAVKRVVRAGRPVMAAGGVTTIDDLRSLRAAGAAGAVVGRAVLDGTLDLGAAIAEMG